MKIFYIILFLSINFFINTIYAEQKQSIHNEQAEENSRRSIKETNLSEPSNNNDINNLKIERIAGSIDILEKFIVTLEVNYEDTNILSTVIKNHLDHLLIPAEDIQNLGIKTEYLNSGSIYLEGKHYIDLDLLLGTKYYLDVQNLFLAINFQVDGMTTQNLVGIEKEKIIFSKVSNGGTLDYDFNLINSNDSQYISGIQGINYFSEQGVLNNSVFLKRIISKQRMPSYNQLSRLESNWTFDRAEDTARWRIGDSITKAATWSGSTRFAGVQYSTNFAVRPDFVTYPLLDFAGQAELPSTIDVYANSLQVYHNELRTGNFNINQLPVITGKGEMIVKTTDITGKVKTFTLPYYVSPLLLKEGLSDFSYEAGVQRVDYGISSNKYKKFLFSTDYNRGINDNWTLGTHLEGKVNKASLGISSHFNLYGMGIISTSLASNIVEKAPGQRLLLGYSYRGDKFDFNINSTFNHKKFIDVYNDYANSSGLAHQVSFGYVDQRLGSFYVNYTSTPIFIPNDTPKKIQLVSTTYERNITKNSLIKINIGTTFQKKDRNSFASLSFNINLDNKFISAGSSYQNKVKTDQLNVSSSANKPLGWGYDIYLYKDQKFSGYDIELNKKGSVADSTLYLFNYGKNPSQQFNIFGSVVVIDKDIYFTRAVNNSLVLVKTGKLVDIPVYNNNQYVGNTNENGKALVPNVAPYVPSEIRLDEKKVPLNINFSQLALKVTPPWNSGVVLDFDVYKVRSLEMKVVDTKGEVLPLNTTLIIDGIGDEVLVGYNGKVYINDVKDLNSLIGKEVCQVGKCCTFEAIIDNTGESPILDLGTVTCD